MGKPVIAAAVKAWEAFAMEFPDAHTDSAPEGEPARSAHEPVSG
jgi:hypothetical protein